MKFKLKILKNYIGHFIKHNFGKTQIWQIASLIIILTFLSLLLFASGINAAANRHKVSAAIVNNDIPVTIDGQLAPLGRQFASELAQIKDTNYTWIITSAQDAQNKLNSGEYMAVVTLPNDFSKTIASIQNISSSAKAFIQVETSNKADSNTDDITQSLIEAAEKAFSDTYVLDSFLSQMFVGFKDLKNGLGSAADGAKQLAEGSDQLSNGLNQLSNKSKDLRNGTKQLAEGLNQINNGMKEMPKVDAKQMEQILQYAKTISRFLATLDLYKLDNEVAKPICQLADKYPEIPSLKQICDNIKNLTSDITCIENGGPGINPECTNLLYADFIGVKKIDELISKDSKMAENLISQLPILQKALNDLANGSNQLSNGVNLYTAGIDEIAKNAPKLTDGAKTLAGGLQEANQQIPNYSENDQIKIKSFLQTPIQISNIDSNSYKELSYLIVIILWLVCYANSSILRLVPARIRQSLQKSSTLAFSSLIPSLTISIIESSLVAIIGQIFIKLPPNIFLSLILSCIFIGITFAMVMQTLGLLLKNKSASLTMGLIIGIIYILENAFIYIPNFVHLFDFIMPTNYASQVLASIILQNGNLLGSIIFLIIYALISFSISILMISQRRKYTISEIYAI
ncbi:MAG: hypothetical protein LBT91_03700 [Bifidobacteriaceae bacterium]|jgi:putative membrane protein|nr:hypothetical protein [Bifidobacteriaceae bacterium]